MPKKPIGARYGRLAILSSVVGGWLCRCDCGTEKVITGSHLRSRAVVSCGCHNQEQRIGRPKTHGMSNSRAYVAWRSMRQRCEDPNNISYWQYGRRGITVCERWASFDSFLADMGEPGPGMSLDRKDGDGNYEPGNCRWATRVQQARNRRCTRLVTIGEDTKPLAEWCEVTGVEYHHAYGRLRNGDAPEKVFRR